MKIKEALIALTYRCNARCAMCHTWQHPSAPPEEITPRHLESLPNGLSFCNLTGGEPLLRQDLEDFIRLMQKKAKRVVISTNGYFTQKIVSLAQKYPRLGFRISIEGLPQTNDELRGIEHGFDHGMRTLLQLHRLGRKDIGFGITLSDKNITDLMELYELSAAMNLEFATACTHNTYYFHKFDNQITKIPDFKKEFKKLITGLLTSRRPKNWFRAYFNYGLLNYACGNKRLLDCPAANEVIFIDPLGNVLPCNAMEKSLGSLKNNTFTQILNSPEAQKVYQEVRACQKNCWMVGTASPAMKKNIFKPAIWVLKNKARLASGKELELCL